MVDILTGRIIKMLGGFMKDSIKAMMTDKYDENLWAFISDTVRFSPQTAVETYLRSQEGVTIDRPLGSPKKFPGLNQLMFNIAQLQTMPTSLKTRVDTRVIIGKNCPKPLCLDIPILIAGMSYGSSLSEKAKTALAKGASEAGTAANTGEGPFLESERGSADKLILQYNRGSWNKSGEILRQADAVEIQIGQGAYGGVGHIIQSSTMNSRLRSQLGLRPGQDGIVHSRLPGVNHPSQLADLVSDIKKVSAGIPVGVKIAAGKNLEKDMNWAVEAQSDFIVVDGAQAATGGSPPILQDDFGVPSVFAISRAGQFLERQNLKDKVSLIVSGGLHTPGDMLKALALGADAVYIGAAALFAMTHTQVLRALPFEPPTQMVWYNGKMAADFDVEAGAENLAKYLRSCTNEMVEAVRAMGKTSLKQVSRADLSALDSLTAQGLGVPLASDSSLMPNP